MYDLSFWIMKPLGEIIGGLLVIALLGVCLGVPLIGWAAFDVYVLRRRRNRK